MADAAKKEKIAAAKKKLKQFQQSGRKSSTSPAPNSGNKTKLNGTNGTPGRGSTPASGSPRRPSTPVTSKQNKEELPATASTEKLQQLSRQINGLITDSSAYLQNDGTLENPSISDLESRNRDLASFLQQHAQANEQLHKQLNELKSHNAKLQSSIDHERKGFDDKIKRELGALKEQLQVHIQTIGILVAEKTELQSALNQSSKQGETRAQEIEELQGRLKASRTRVAELERSFNSASSSSQKLEKSTKEFSKEIDRLKLDLYKSNKALEEQQQKNTELSGKLQTKAATCAKAEDQVLDLRGKLEMSQLHIEQLRNGGAQTNDSSEEIDKLVAERSELQVKVEEYEGAFQRLTAERDQLSAQYQQYIDQLTANNQELQLKTVQMTEDREGLLKQYAFLEATMQELQSKQDSVQTETSELEKEKHELFQNHAKLKADFDALKALYDTQVADNSQLSHFISEKEMRLEELEMTVQRLSDSSVDREQLLETMQSDKTALSRAMAQNKELKHQLAELQNGFVKMSNDNMDLMTQLTAEQHIAKELGQRLSQQEEELKEVREQILEKEGHVRQLESDATVLKSQHFSHDQIEDRLRHYEAQAQLVETLQRELNSAQDTINALTNQNSILQSHMANSDNTGSNDADDNSALVASMSASVKQLEMERNQVVQRLKEEETRANDIQNKLHQLQNDLAHETPATLNGDVISKAQFEALQHAMKQLEGKYTSTIRDKADLSDKTEQLEHLIMQLQGETDTIGEYVTLYQHQRSVLRQRAVEKDDYIARLSRERGEMQDKLSQLQALVMQLLSERQTLHHYNQENKAVSNPGLTASPNTPAEDWPDYTSDSDSDASEVEAIIGGTPEGAAAAAAAKAARTSPEAGADAVQKENNPQWNIPSEDQTAKRIMNLLSEIGSSTLDSPTYANRNVVNCNRCTGRLMVL